MVLFALWNECWFWLIDLIAINIIKGILVELFQNQPKSSLNSEKLTTITAHKMFR